MTDTELKRQEAICEIDKIDDAIEITAWMPLPEPYGGDNE